MIVSNEFSAGGQGVVFMPVTALGTIIGAPVAVAPQNGGSMRPDAS
jgi:hypothetical protein